MHAIKPEDLLSKDLKLLPYGEPGTGKTRFCASVAEVLYTLIFDVDGGTKTVLQVPKAWRDNMVIARMDSFKDLDILYQAAYKNDPDYWTKILYPKGDGKITKPFEAICADTWSEMNWEITEEKRRLIGKQGGTSLNFRENVQIQDWQQILDLNRKAIEAFCDLPLTFVCTLHEQITQDDKTKIIRGLPSINGKLAPEIGKYFDIVGHMSTNVQGDYVMETQNTARFQAKSRLKLDKVIKSPTFKVLVDALKAV
jgi:hypothetical protein